MLRPTLEDFVLEMPRGAQVIYPKDLAPICMLADIGPGVRVFETGVGSGALSMTMLRWGAEIVGYELREDFANRARNNVAQLPRRGRAGALPRRAARQLRGHRRATSRSTGSCSTCPSRGRSSRTPSRCCAPGGILVAYTPSITQAAQVREALRGQRGSTPARSRCCTAAGTSRARRCGPTTAWSPTPAS